MDDVIKPQQDLPAVVNKSHIHTRRKNIHASLPEQTSIFDRVINWFQKKKNAFHRRHNNRTARMPLVKNSNSTTKDQ